ncbi:MAG: DUF3306 domain-containing protein [bacterium]|nr:DUF3306 domain-containing protein [bacterium]
MTTKKADSPLSRWSQRKILVQEGKITSDAPDEIVSDPGTMLQSAQPSELSEQPDEKNVEQQAALPPEDEIDTEKFANIDFDALDYDSDYTQFMARNVPDIVKRKALRALWNSDPVFANLDGLNDYDEDFTIVEPMTKAIESAWNMGKGYMTAEEEKKRAANEEVQVASADDTDSEVPKDEELGDHEANDIAEETVSDQVATNTLQEIIETS